MHAPMQFPGTPPSPAFENQTIRMVVRPSAGGERIRIRLSNEFGTTPLVIGAAHIALASDGSAILPQSDHALTFGGRRSVTIPPGAPVLSDPVDWKLTRFTEVTVSIYLTNKAQANTVHFWGQHETYISGPGDFTADTDIANSSHTSSWYWLAALDVWVADQTGTTVAFGDSITDGAGAKQGDYADWPDLLAVRLATQQRSASLAVVNEGIGGNRILHDGAGVSALARFDRDVLANAGVVNLIVLEGINDIGWPNMKPPKSEDGTIPKQGPFAAEAVTAQDLIFGLQQMVERGHEHGIRVFGATLTPFEGANYYTPEGESTRQAVNEWIRTSGAFDGVIDFDRAVRDSNDPAKFRQEYQSGDHLHPSAKGYKAMADAINLSVLKEPPKDSRHN